MMKKQLVKRISLFLLVCTCFVLVSNKLVEPVNCAEKKCAGDTFELDLARAVDVGQCYCNGGYGVMEVKCDITFNPNHYCDTGQKCSENPPPN